MILFVCEGNVCRSPLAVGLVQHALDARSVQVPLSSAGIRALVGEPVDNATLITAQRFGVDLDDHRARQITSEDVRGSRLVLAASRRIRRAVVQLHPPAVQYSFTIRQLGRIIAATGNSFQTPDTADPAELVDAIRLFAIRHRGLQAPPDPIVDDILDPYRRPVSAHVLAAQQMAPSLGLLSAALGAPATFSPQWT